MEIITLPVLPYELEGQTTLHGQKDSLRQSPDDADLHYENIVHLFSYFISFLKQIHSL